MKITVMTVDEQIVTLDVDRDESVENLKALLEVETQVPLQQQQLLYNGREIRNSEKLSAVGVSDGDLVMMLSNTSASGSRAGAPGNEVVGFNPDGSAVNPAAFQQQIRSDSNLMAQLFQSDPELAQAILGNDLNRLQDILRARRHQKSELRRQQEEEMALLYADPFDVEAQRKIEAAIHQKGIDENWAAALEYNPEAFARVVMLYPHRYRYIAKRACDRYGPLIAIDYYVSDSAKLTQKEKTIVPEFSEFFRAFVDSGAQSTIISKSCAERCGLLRLLDTRYKGIAHGVGQSEILGRIHVAPIKIGRIFYPCSFMVLDAPNMEFLFGLDMLRKHQCMIDLKENVLRVGGGEVAAPFLAEKDIPSQFMDEGRFAKEASSSGAQATSATKGNISAPGGPSGSAGKNGSQGRDFEAKVAKLVELGFGREQVIQALKLFDGNEEQAAGFLFGG
ncbi:DNA damage-inducible protein 1 [Orobanche gracilis]